MIGTRLDNDTADAVQDVEIPHIPAPESCQEEEDGLTSSTSQARLNSSSGEVQTPEDDDYLAPLFGSSSGLDRESSAQLEETLRGLGDTVEHEQVREVREGDARGQGELPLRHHTETEFYKKLFLSLMTKAEQDN